MSRRQYEDVFSKDTPPSEFDDLDLTTILACSPAIPHLNCLTPDSFAHSYSSTTSSDSTKSASDFDMSSQAEEMANELFFSNSTNTSFYPQSMLAYEEPLSYGSGEVFPIYDQQQWMSLQAYSQPPPFLNSCAEAPPSSVFPTFDAPPSSSANIIHPTLQPIHHEASFNFNTLPQHTIPSHGYLAASPALSQARSTLSNRSNSHGHAESVSSTSRSCSPNPSVFQPNDRGTSNLSTPSSSSSANLTAYGVPIRIPGSNPSSEPQTWRCAYPGCTSRAVFTRGCDLRKHFNRHSKHLFCRVEGCPQSAPRDIGDGKRGSVSATGGFSSKKDRARHEAKHNPGIRCEWQGPDGEECGRVFSRMDNMKDHVRRIHGKSSR